MSKVLARLTAGFNWPQTASVTTTGTTVRAVDGSPRTKTLCGHPPAGSEYSNMDCRVPITHNAQ